MLTVVCLLIGTAAAIVTMVSAKSIIETGKPEVATSSDTLVCTSTCVAELLSDGTVRIHRVPELADAVCEINTVSVAQWEDIVSLRGTFYALYGIDREGRLHISSGLEDYVREQAENHTTSETASLASIIQDYPAIVRYLGETKLSDGNVFESGEKPRVFLTKTGELVTVEQEGAECRFVTLAEQVASFEGEYYLRYDGSIGTMNEQGSLAREYRRLNESGQKFCGLAVVREGIFGLCGDGTVVTYSPEYYASGVGDWKDVTVIRGGGSLVMALHWDGHVSAALARGKTSEALAVIEGWENIVAIATDGRIAAGKAADGTVYTVVIETRK